MVQLQNQLSLNSTHLHYKHLLHFNRVIFIYHYLLLSLNLQIILMLNHQHLMFNQYLLYQLAFNLLNLLIIYLYLNHLILLLLIILNLIHITVKQLILLIKQLHFYLNLFILHHMYRLRKRSYSSIV